VGIALPGFDAVFRVAGAFVGAGLVCLAFPSWLDGIG
jgi:hypothetical protein